MYINSKELLKISFYKNHAETIFVLFCCSVFVVYSAIYILGNYQTANGDFGQYYIHGQNILKGRNWSALVEDYPAVLPGYPYLLAFVSKLFGDGIFFVGLINSIIWAATSSIAYVIFKDHFRIKSLKYIYLISCLFMPYILLFQQEGQPNITYCFSFFLGIFAAKNIVKRKFLISSVILLLLASIMRADSLVLYIAVVIYFLSSKANKYIWVPILGMVITVSLDFIIDKHFGMTSNFSLGKKLISKSSNENISAIKGIIDFFELYFNNIIGYITEIPELFLPHTFGSANDFRIEATNGFKTQFGILSIVIIVVFLSGFLNVKRVFWGDDNESSLLSFYRLLLLGHIAFIALFFLKAVALRYLLPIAPIFLFYVITGFERLGSFLKYKKEVTFSIAGLLSLIVVLSGINLNSDFAKRKSFLFKPYVTEVADYTADIKGDRLVGFWKPRLMTVLLDRRGKATHKTAGIRQVHQVKKLFQEDGVFVAFVPALNEDMKKHLTNNDSICPTWKNPWFIVYQRTNDDRVCLVIEAF